MLLRWPTKTYLVDHVHRFIYCPIPKVACTSILQWCLAVSGESATVPSGNVHALAQERRSLHAAGWPVARSVLRDSRYFKFAFVRHPLPRLVSAYANKFLKVESLAWPMIRTIQARQGSSNTGIAQRCLRRWSAARRRGLTDAETEQCVTFRQFVEYVATKHAASLEPHWRPQHFFLGRQSFDFVGRLERLEVDFASVQRTLGLQVPLPQSNRSSYAGVDDGDTVADWEAPRLRALPMLPAWQRFYTPDLRMLVARIYARDFEHFGYDVHWQGAEGACALGDSQAAADSATILTIRRPSSSRRAA